MLFPFAPGIPWRVKDKKFVMSHMQKGFWEKTVSHKSFCIVCFSGIFETIFALSFIEYLRLAFPDSKIEYCGNYSDIVYRHGIAQITTRVTEDILLKYPTPVFFDKNNTAYLNIAINYKGYKSIDGIGFKSRNESLVCQLCDNTLLLKSLDIKPKLVFSAAKFDSWKTLHKFDKGKYILFVLKSARAIHDCDMLGMDMRSIREFAAIVKPMGYKVVVLGEASVDPGYAILSRFDLDIFFALVKDAKFVLSHHIDFLLSAMLLSNATIIGKKNDTEHYNLIKNYKKVDVINEVIEAESVDIDFLKMRILNG